MKLIIASITALLLCTPSMEAKGDIDMENIAKWLEGSFSSERQAQRDTNYLNISLHMRRIWTDRTDGYWFYVEQALAAKPESPYRQRVYHVQRLEEGMIESAVYAFTDPKKVIGWWQTPEKFDELSTDDISLRIGCEVYLQATPEGFSGSTHGMACESTINGASYASSEVKIYPNKIVSWDRGFNASGEQVWGAEDGGYWFIRVE